MCGIAGLFAGVNGRDEAINATARRMSGAIGHRGPDDSGVWGDVQAGVALGHQRLAIVDLSPAGHQPMLSRSGRWVIAFNGEIYNHLAVRSELQQAGEAPDWRGQSDTETLLAAIDAWGVEDAIARMVGMFAIALWDRSRLELHLIRDRMGEKPLYYGWAGATFVFASELKALRAHPTWRGEVNRDVLALFLRHSYVPSPFTIYRDVWKLPPAHRLCVTCDGLAAREVGPAQSYWTLDGEAARRKFANIDEPEATIELERLCKDAVALQRVADVPLGAFLSGGVDSSLIVALMQAQSARPVRTFTIGFAEAQYNEAGFAKNVARHLKTEHTELFVSPAQARELIPSLPTVYDEPFADSSQIPTLLVSQLARRHVTVSLSGDGGDELFGGYNRYFLGRDLRRTLLSLPFGIRRMLARGVRSTPAWMLDAILRPLGIILPRLRVSQPSDKAYKAAEVLELSDECALYRRLVSHWNEPNGVVIGGHEPQTALDQLVTQCAASSSFEQWMMTADIETYLPDDILVKVDRAAMAFGLETRAPFLDHRVVEFSLGLPLDLKIRKGQGKWLLRQLLYKYVPRSLIERPKMGFGVPIDSWLRGPLRDWAEALLDGARLRREGFLDPAHVRAKWSEHLAGERNWQYHLWDVLMFEAWLEHEGA